MWKSNFDFLEKEDWELFRLCESAEIMLNKEANVTMFKLRQFIERICQDTIEERKLKGTIYKQNDLNTMIKCLYEGRVIDFDLNRKFNEVRCIGNEAAHDFKKKSYNDAVDALKNSYDIAVWYYNEKYNNKLVSGKFLLENIKTFDEKNLQYFIEIQMDSLKDYYENQNRFIFNRLEKVQIENEQNYKAMMAELQKVLNTLQSNVKNEASKETAIDFNYAKTANNVTNSKQTGIGNYVKTEFTKAFEEELVDEEVIACLQDMEYSKKVFNLSSFSVIKKIDKNKSINEQRFVKGHSRYYDLILHYENDEYLLCSQWMYDKHFEKLSCWFENLGGKDFEYKPTKASEQISKKERKITAGNSYILRLIRTIGMSTFVKYYEYLGDAKYSQERIIDLFIKNNEGYVENSAVTKANVGKRIFRENLNLDALEIIARASKTDEDTIMRAQELLRRFKIK